ncbi:acyl-CoA N-acyltransferase, partial [Mycena amicta]
LLSRSGRVQLLPPAEANDVFVAALRSHPETRRYLPQFVENFSVADAAALRVARAGDKTRVGFDIRTTKGSTSDSETEFVGSTSITHIDSANRSCSVGILIRAEYARGGYATDALHALLAYIFEEQHQIPGRIHRVTFRTSVKNVGMRGWLEMAGAVLEGVMRDAWPDPEAEGGYTGVCVYSILEDDWVNVVKKRLEERIDRR